MAVAKPVNEIFNEAAHKYGWETVLTDFMISPDGLGATSLKDFTFLTEAQLEKVIEKVEVKNKFQQSSRIRQAQHS